MQCGDTALDAQATLASDILGAPVLAGLDAEVWSAVLKALVALAPQSFDRASMELRRTGSELSASFSFYYLYNVDVVVWQPMCV